jgi:hypothetical protein
MHDCNSECERDQEVYYSLQLESYWRKFVPINCIQYQFSISELLYLSIKIIYMYFKAFLLNLWNILNTSACDLFFTCMSAEI